MASLTSSHTYLCFIQIILASISIAIVALSEKVDEQGMSAKVYGLVGARAHIHWPAVPQKPHGLLLVTLSSRSSHLMRMRVHAHT